MSHLISEAKPGLYDPDIFWAYKVLNTIQVLRNEAFGKDFYLSFSDPEPSQVNLSLRDLELLCIQHEPLSTKQLHVVNNVPPMVPSPSFQRAVS